MLQQSTQVSRLAKFVFLFMAGLLAVSNPCFAANEHVSKPFQGVKANTGTVTYSRQGDRDVLTLSEDFRIPDAPAPHWQVVDSLGNTYLLERLKVKGDKINKQIKLPTYIHDVARVQIWCAWAETLLGETSFDAVITLRGDAMETASIGETHTSKPFEGVKANTGTVTHSKRGGQSVLTLSEDFKIPDAPAPHWQIVDSQGHTYLLQRLDIKGGKFNRQITVPAYIPDIARVQIWCAWAEVLLGEAAFDTPVK